MARVRHTGDENHGNVLGVLIGLERLAHLDAVHFGHDHVKQNDVWQLDLGNLQGLGAADGHAERVVASQYIGEDFDIARLVVDDEHPGFVISASYSWRYPNLIAPRVAIVFYTRPVKAKKIN